MPTPPPCVGERYEIGDLLGRGGMADVYRARDIVLDRDVAVKIMRDHSEDDISRLADEALLLSTLDDTTIVTLLDAGVGDEHPWIALELVEGETLRDVMLAGPIPAATAQHIGHHVARGLAHAHAHGIVHRDVKPSNIMRTSTGATKLADFGIARRSDRRDGATLTGHTVGTAAYLSPEQVRGETVTGAADVYSLGLVLLEALTAVRAYPGPAAEAAFARLHRAPLIPTSLPRGWPGLIAAMTAASPGDRPDAAEVARRLHPDRVLGQPAHDLAPTVLVRPLRPVAPGRHRRGILTGVAALAMAATMVVVEGSSLPTTSVAEADRTTPAERGFSSVSTTRVARAAALAVRERRGGSPEPVVGPTATPPTASPTPSVNEGFTATTATTTAGADAPAAPPAPASTAPPTTPEPAPAQPGGARPDGNGDRPGRGRPDHAGKPANPGSSGTSGNRSGGRPGDTPGSSAGNGRGPRR